MPMSWFHQTRRYVPRGLREPRCERKRAVKLSPEVNANVQGLQTRRLDEHLREFELLDELRGGGVHLCAREVVDGEAVDDGPLAVLARHWEGVDEAVGHAVGVAGGVDGHRDDFVGAEHPVAHVVADGLGGRGGRRQLARRDNGGASLLHGADEIALEPGLVALLHDLGAGDGRVANVRVLRRRVVPPDAHACDLADGDAAVDGDHRGGAVVVEPRQRRDVLQRHERRRLGQDVGVRVGRVADDEALDVRFGVLKRLTLRVEDADVLLHHVLALHALLARERPEEDGIVHILESDRRIIGAHNSGDQWVGQVLQLHHNATKHGQCRRDVQQVQDDRLVHAKDRAAGKARQE
mmetsp:Transcript_6856/g.14991  ORF Transcript_6856/g.14991 Transcript_6856/m.14991 type:complete len:351 (+) Transcript_6856:226-1278(+)